jgi:hypothetical protein
VSSAGSARERSSFPHRRLSTRLSWQDRGTPGRRGPTAHPPRIRSQWLPAAGYRRRPPSIGRSRCAGRSSVDRAHLGSVAGRAVERRQRASRSVAARRPGLSSRSGSGSSNIIAVMQVVLLWLWARLPISWCWGSSAIAWVLSEGRMAFPRTSRVEVTRLAVGDELFIYTTRAAFGSPTRDRGRVIGRAIVTSSVTRNWTDPSRSPDASSRALATSGSRRSRPSVPVSSCSCSSASLWPFRIRRHGALTYVARCYSCPPAIRRCCAGN